MSTSSLPYNAVMLFLLAFLDTSKIVRAELPSPPSRYVPLSREEIEEFAKINRFERRHMGGGTGEEAKPVKFSPLPSDTLLSDFEVIDYTGWIPPDPQIAVGTRHLGEVVNTSIAFYRKDDGVRVYYNTLRGFFSSVIPSGGMAFDPKIAYDIPAGRWLVLALYYNSSSQTSYYLLAVSQTSNPLGGWYYYRLNAKYDDATYRNNWADYPSIGFNDRWVVLSSQQIGFSSYDYYPKVRVLNKDSAYNGTLNGWTEDFVGSELGCIYNWPKISRSTYDYSGDVYVVAFRRMYKIYGPTNSPQISPCITLPIGSYSYPPNAPQGGGYDSLEVVGATFQVYYLNGRLYYTFHEEHPLSPYLVSGRLVILDTSGAVIEDLRLYENGASWIYPAVSVSPKGWAVSFTRVGTVAGAYPSAAYVSRASYDTTPSPPRVYRAGLSWYFNDHGYGRNRWGDYFGGGPDPVDSSLWVVAELPMAGNDSLWTTWVAHVSFYPPTLLTSEAPDPVEGKGAIYTVDGRRTTDLKAGRIYFVVDRGKVRKVLKLRQ